MCGRFTLRTPLSVLIEQFCLADAEPLEPRYNIAPMQAIAVVRWEPDAARRRLDRMRWGLVPAWAKDATFGARMINARAESVAEKPTFRSAFKHRRCLVPADGYYEWRNVGSRKQPYYLHRADGQPFAIAGLWEAWRGGEGPDTEPLRTCVLITTEANELTRPIHDRMPVILETDSYETWLDPRLQDRAQLERLLRPCDARVMVADPVSTHVNNARHEGPQCIVVERGPC